MMVSKKETVLIRSFVSEQLCNEPDLSTLTMGILKKRYLAHVKCESLSQEAKKFMKLVVEEELMKIQENDKNGTEEDTKKLQNKRKRGEENEEVESEGENESRAKKSRSNHSSSPESEDADDCKTGSEDEEQIKSPSKVTKQEVKKSPLKRPAKSKHQMTSDDSSDDETDKSEKRESGSECGDSPKKTVKKKASTPKKGKTRSCETSGGKQTQDSESDADDCKTGSEDEEQIKFPSKVTKQKVKKSQLKRPANSKHQGTSDDSSDDETDKSEKRESGSECDDSPKKTVKKKASTPKKGKTRSCETSGGKQTQESNKDSESDAGSKSSRNVKINDSEPSDSEKADKVLSEKDNNDSDSSSLPSLEDEGESRTKNEPKYKKKQKTGREDKSTRGQKDEDKAIVRLKRYIALCGVRRNYKKLLDDCRSVRSKVAVLKKELADLGVHGNPSVDKCKKVRMKREEAQEVAELDVRNIITTQGRPKRRGTSASQEQHDPPSSAFQHALNSDSDSDSDRENNSRRGRRKISQWANLHGIISDDADSD